MRRLRHKLANAAETPARRLRGPHGARASGSGWNRAQAPGRPIPPSAGAILHEPTETVAANVRLRPVTRRDAPCSHDDDTARAGQADAASKTRTPVVCAPLPPSGHTTSGEQDASMGPRYHRRCRRGRACRGRLRRRPVPRRRPETIPSPTPTPRSGTTSTRRSTSRTTARRRAATTTASSFNGNVVVIGQGADADTEFTVGVRATRSSPGSRPRASPTGWASAAPSTPGSASSQAHRSFSRCSAGRRRTSSPASTTPRPASPRSPQARPACRTAPVPPSPRPSRAAGRTPRPAPPVAAPTATPTPA